MAGGPTVLMYKQLLNRLFGKVVADEPKIAIAVDVSSLASGMAIAAASDVYEYIAGDAEFPQQTLLDLLRETREKIVASAPTPEDLIAFRESCSDKSFMLSQVAVDRIRGAEQVVGQQ